MSVRVVTDTFDRIEWNSVAGHPMQSWEWGEARKQMDVEVVRVGEFDATTLKNVFQMTLHRIPVINKRTAYLPRSVFPSKNVLQFLAEYCKENNIISVKLEPYGMKNQKSGIRNQKVIPSTTPLFPEWTIIIDLTKSENELLKQMKPKTRYNLRLAQKKGVVVKEETTQKGFETFVHLYLDTCKRQNYYGHSYEYHKAIFETLKKNTVHIFIAYYQNVPLAAYELFHFKDTVYYAYGGSSNLHRNVMAAQLIMWESIRHAKRLSAKIFDMWGSLQPSYPPNHPWAGFTRFKEGFGGKFIQLGGSYDLVIDPLLYRLFTSTYTIRTAYLIVKGKIRV